MRVQSAMAAAEQDCALATSCVGRVQNLNELRRAADTSAAETSSVSTFFRQLRSNGGRSNCGKF
jgi:type II secretory pathway component PulJ